MSPAAEVLPRVVADGPLDPVVLELLRGKVQLLPWQTTETGSSEPIDGVYTYGHPALNGQMLDRLPGVRVISNYGVGVDHIHLADARSRSIPVGNTPGILNGATADMAFALLLAAGRRLAEGDRYARSPEFTVYDPGYMLGREIHSAVLGIIGMGRIGRQIAKRGCAFDMTVLYHNRRRDAEGEKLFDAQYCTLDEILTRSDYLVICLPLNQETRGLIAARELRMMKPSAILVNVARGPIVDTDALTDALQSRSIYAAGLDVTDPEPLPRNHPLLTMNNVTITPHLGSATAQTRQAMAELSVENLLRGLRREPLLHEVKA